jgi:uncharacterized protein
MRTIAIETSDGRPLAICGLADRSLARMRGLLGRRGLGPGEGIVLHPASTIHTAFMRFAIDVVFVDHALRVQRIERSLPPWHAASRRRTAAVIELAAGECDRESIAVGDRLVARLLPAEATSRPRGRGAVGSLAAVLAVAALVHAGATAAGLLAAVACAVLVVLGYVDAVSRRLPNRIVLPAAAAALAWRLATAPEHWRVWLAASLGAGVAFVAVSLAFPAALGMGDAKLVFLLGAALGAQTLPALLLGFLAAGLAGVALVARHGRAGLARPLPLGPFLAVAAIALLLALPPGSLA